jgi:hypothetical protein
MHFLTYKSLDLSVKGLQTLKMHSISLMLHLLKEQQPQYESTLTERQMNTVQEEVERAVTAFIELDIRNLRRANTRGRS